MTPPSSDSFLGLRGETLKRLFRRQAKKAGAKAADAIHKGSDFIEAATVNADHPYLPKSPRESVRFVFGAAAALAGAGAVLVWATHGIPATIGYGMITAGKGVFFRGCRVLKPYEPHKPAPWTKGTRILAIADFLEASSRNLPHPWMKPANAGNAKTRLIAGASAAAIGFLLGITTHGVPSIIGSAAYAIGGFVSYRAFRTLRPFNPNNTPTGAAPAASLG